ncbi:MAG: STN domain-containing protein [Planctomycetaceae bacterium]
MSEFSCPHCQTTLRFQGRTSSGRSMDCPDCGQLLTLERDPEGSVTAKRTPAVTLPPAGKNPAARRNWSNRLTQLRQIASNPVVVAWSLAGGGTLLLLLSILGPAERPPLTHSVPSNPRPPMTPERQQPATAENSNASPKSIEVATGVQPSVSKPPQAATAVAATPPVSIAHAAGQQAPVVPVVPAPVVPAPVVPAPVVPNQNTPQPDTEGKDTGGKDTGAPLPTIDIANRLTQVILEFDQPTPLEFTEHLAQLEEFIGAPVRLDAGLTRQSPELLKQKIGLKLKQTTLGKILNGIVSKAGLTYEIRRDHILIVRKSSGKSSVE